LLTSLAESPRNPTIRISISMGELMASFFWDFEQN
jgi:hypothetical protein